MDNSVMESGRLLPVPNDCLLDLESPVHGHKQIQLGHPVLSRQHWMGSAGGLENDHWPIDIMEAKCSAPKGSSMKFNKGKAVSLPDATDMAELSEDDEPSLTEDGNDEIPLRAKGKKGSPWQRMKWTDNVIRLLIAVVACVDDDGTFDGIEGLKRKSRILQKKGKWKTVSKIMISKGCHVSPQQCEDKFNDLNKRYKKLNHLLGRGTSCRVVENPAIMDSMPQLSAKAKDTVRKILNSKHLFYKEMCAYHNGQRIPNFPDIDLQHCASQLESSLKDSHGSEEEEAQQSDDSDDDDVDDDDDDDDDDDEADESDDGEIAGKYDESKKMNEGDACLLSQAGGLCSFEVELAEVLKNPKVSLRERREWIKKQKLQLLNQKISIQAEAFGIEKQWSKWVQYRSKKDEEFERLRLENERMRLENEQSILQLRQKHLEMDFRSLEASLDPTSLGIDPNQGEEQSHLGRHQ